MSAAVELRLEVPLCDESRPAVRYVFFVARYANRAGIEVPGWAARIYRANVAACLRYWTCLGLLMALNLADEQRRLSTSQLPCGRAGAVLMAVGWLQREARRLVERGWRRRRRWRARAC